MKTLLAIILLMAGSVMASDLEALKAQIISALDQTSANNRQQIRDIDARNQAAEASIQSIQQTASVVNAINSASAQSTVVTPYHPIPVVPVPVH